MRATASDVDHITEGLKYEVIASVLPDAGWSISIAKARLRFGFLRKLIGQERHPLNEGMLAAIYITSLLKHPLRFDRDEFDRKFGSGSVFIRTIKRAYVDFLDEYSLLLTSSEVEDYYATTDSTEGGQKVFAEFKNGDWSDIYRINEIYVRSLQRFSRRYDADFPTELKANLARDLSRRMLKTREVTDDESSAKALAIQKQIFYVMHQSSLFERAHKPMELVMMAAVPEFDARSAYEPNQTAVETISASQQPSENYTLGFTATFSIGGDVIDRIEPFSSAETAGLRVGDVITHLDGQAMVDFPDDAYEQIYSGAVGTTVKITVRRGSRIFEVSLLRNGIDEVPVVHDQRPWGLVATVHLPNLAFGSADRFINILDDLGRSRIAGLILDLRGNRGGSRDEAAGVIAALTGESSFAAQVAVEPNGAARARSIVVSARHAKIRYEGNLVVLIDEISASGAELIALVLQQQNRALVIGYSRSRGKGTYQQRYPLSAFIFRDQVTGDYERVSQKVVPYFRITEGLFVGPNGQSPEKVGVRPDILLSADKNINSLATVNRPPLPPFSANLNQKAWISNELMQRLIAVAQDSLHALNFSTPEHIHDSAVEVLRLANERLSRASVSGCGPILNGTLPN